MSATYVRLWYIKYALLCASRRQYYRTSVSGLQKATDDLTGSTHRPEIVSYQEALAFVQYFVRFFQS